MLSQISLHVGRRGVQTLLSLITYTDVCRAGKNGLEMQKEKKKTVREDYRVNTDLFTLIVNDATGREGRNQ